MFLSGVAPYALDPEHKRRFLLPRLQELLAYHEARCPLYAGLVADWNAHRKPVLESGDDLPYIPVTIFKEFDLRSTADGAMALTSSATTSGTPSKVYADKTMRRRQSLSSSMIWSDRLGPARRPYLVFDAEATVRGHSALSARGAAILSLAHQATEVHFVMEDQGGQLQLNLASFQKAMDAIGDQPFFAYAFTYILYQAHLELQKLGLPKSPAQRESVLLHSGGWKRLQSLAVDKATFNARVAETWGLAPTQVIDFYGAIEQVGIPYPDCPEGVKHVPYWADVVIRRSDSCEPVQQGETGLLQLINCLPLSGPNYSVLTEDLGKLVFEDGCPCGRRGRAFTFQGRAPRAEVRGCSDVAR